MYRRGRCAGETERRVCVCVHTVIFWMIAAVPIIFSPSHVNLGLWKGGCHNVWYSSCWKGAGEGREQHWKRAEGGSGSSERGEGRSRVRQAFRRATVGGEEQREEGQGSRSMRAPRGGEGCAANID